MKTSEQPRSKIGRFFRRLIRLCTGQVSKLSMYDFFLKLARSYRLTQFKFLRRLYCRYYKKYAYSKIAKLVKTDRFKSPILHVEPTNICNANCVTCPNRKQTRKKGTMDYELYCKIIDQANELGIDEVRHSFMGEPLLDKSLAQKIEYAKNHHIKTTVIFTNASLLTESKSQELIEAGLDTVFISMDGINKKTYEGIRLNLNFDSVKENILNLLKLRDNQENCRPRIEFSFTVSESNESEIEQFKEYWQEKVDHINISYPHNFRGAYNANLDDSCSQNCIPCFYMWHYIFVLWNGDIVPCCLDYNGDCVLGNVNDSTLKEIWFGGNLENLRQKHLNNQINTIPLCAQCSIPKNTHRWL